MLKSGRFRKKEKKGCLENMGEGGGGFEPFAHYGTSKC